MTWIDIEIIINKNEIGIPMKTNSYSTIYEKLGITPVINAWGVATELGGWTLSPKVSKAMEDANSSQVEMTDLLKKSGEYIAELLGVEAAYITSGGAAAQALSVAACMAGTDPNLIERLPDTTGMKNKVLLHKPNQYMFSRCYTLTGAKLIEVGNENKSTIEDLENSVDADTAAIAYWIQPPTNPNIPSLQETVNFARSKGIPALADACSQIYPLEYFRENAQSADLVTFGGKYVGAPHSSGFVCGKADLIEAITHQSFVAYHYDGSKAVGRAMKIDRQEIVGLVAGVEDWFTMNHEERILGYESRFRTFENILNNIPNVQTERTEIHHYVPYYLKVHIKPDKLGITATEIKAKLDSGYPRIWVSDIDANTIGLSIHTLNEEEDEIVANRINDILIGY